MYRAKMNEKWLLHILDYYSMSDGNMVWILGLEIDVWVWCSDNCIILFDVCVYEEICIIRRNFLFTFKCKNYKEKLYYVGI